MAHTSTNMKLAVCVLLPAILLYIWAVERFRQTQLDQSVTLEDTIPRPSNERENSPFLYEDLGSFRIPREPIVSKDCQVVLRDHSSFCKYQPSSLLDELLLPLVQRLLEYKFGCSTESLRQRDDNSCISLQNGFFKWDFPEANLTDLNSKQLDSMAAFMVPLLFQDFYWLTTASVKDEPFNRTPLHCSLEEEAGFSSSSTNTWQEFLEEMRLCDSVTSSSSTILFLAHGMAIPHRTPSGQELYDELLMPHVTRKLKIMDNDHSFYLPRLYHPNRIRVRARQAKRMAKDIMPYKLFATTPNNTVPRLERDRVLVIIMGTIRGGESTWQTFYKHMLDLNNADLALVIGKASDVAKATSLWKRASYRYEFPEHGDWGDALDTLSAPKKTSWREDYLPFADQKWGLWGGVNGTRGSGAIIFMIRRYVKEFLMTGDVLDKYDRFVVTRSDHYYACDHDLSLLDPSYMWVPKGEDYRYGITDRHLIANRGQILPALTILEPVIKYPHKFASTQFSWLNPEKMIRVRWEEEKLWEWVRRFPRVMFTCAVPGDTSRWALPAFNESSSPEGVYLKYPMEYEEAQCVCGTTNCTFKDQRRRSRMGY